MKQYYTAYRARTMCPVCASESEIFMDGGGVFPTSTTTCINCSHSFIADDFICSFIEKTGNSTVSCISSI